MPPKALWWQNVPLRLLLAPLTWADAEASCNELGVFTVAELSVITTPSQMELYREAVRVPAADPMAMDTLSVIGRKRFRTQVTDNGKAIELLLTMKLVHSVFIMVVYAALDTYMRSVTAAYSQQFSVEDASAQIPVRAQRFRKSNFTICPPNPLADRSNRELSSGATFTLI